MDAPLVERLNRHWPGIRRHLIDAVDADFGVYEDGHLRQKRLKAYLAKHNIPWPLTETGLLALDADTFRAQADRHPQIAPLWELHHTLHDLKLNKLAVGHDGRNRVMLSAFRSRTGRNQPSNAKFVFGPAKWIRGLIKPGPGRAIGYSTVSAQEIAIAGALSGDGALQADLRQRRPLHPPRDPGRPGAGGRDEGQPPRPARHLQDPVPGRALRHVGGGLRRQVRPERRPRPPPAPPPARAVPDILGVGRGQHQPGAAGRADPDGVRLAHLLPAGLEHRPPAEAAPPRHNGGPAMDEDAARYDDEVAVNTRSILNWPMQSNGAEMMRLAVSMAVEDGLMVCARSTTPSCSKRRSTRSRSIARAWRRSWSGRARSSWATAGAAGSTRRSSATPTATWTSAAARCSRRSCGSWRRSSGRREQRAALVPEIVADWRTRFRTRQYPTLGSLRKPSSLLVIPIPQKREMLTMTKTTLSDDDWDPDQFRLPTPTSRRPRPGRPPGARRKATSRPFR